MPQLFAGVQVPRQGAAHRLEPYLTRAMQIRHGRHLPLSRGARARGNAGNAERKATRTGGRMAGSSGLGLVPLSGREAAVAGGGQ